MKPNFKVDVTILVAEDDSGQAKLIEKNLRRVGIDNEIIKFSDGQDVLDFLFGVEGEKEARCHRGKAYVLLLDIRMPRVDGVEVLRRIKQDVEIRKLPVIIFTTADDPAEADRCYFLGCNEYVTKPIEYDDFVDTIAKLGSFLKVVKIPRLNGLQPVTETSS